MNNVIIISGQIFRMLLFIFALVLVVTCLIGVWMVLGTIIHKILWGYSFKASKRDKIIIISSWVAYVLAILLCLIFGISFIVVAFLDGIWWFHIYAAILLLIFPGIAILLLNEYLDMKKRGAIR